MRVLRHLLSIYIVVFYLFSCSSSDNSDGENTKKPATGSGLTYPSGISIRESNQALHIKWSAVTEASSYQLLIDTQNNLVSAQARSNNFKEYLDIKQTQVDIDGLQNNTAYFFVLRSVGANGEVSNYTPPSQGIPKPVTPLEPVDFTATYVSDTSVNLHWLSDVDASSYKLYRAVAGSANYAPLDEALTTNSYIDNTIVASTKYSYQLLASNDVGDSPAATITYVPPPMAPNGFIAIAVNDAAVNLSWTAGDSITDYYELSRSQDGGANFTNVASNITATSYQDSGLVGGSNYVYRIVAVNSGGKSSALSGNYSSPLVPAVPVGFSATFVNATTVNLTWTADASATNGYKLYRAVSGSATFTAVNEAIVAGSNSYTDSTLLTSTKYDYQLLASNLAGNSAPATLTYVPPPLPPTNFSATAVNGGSVDLAWTQGDSISDSFELSRSDNGAAFVAVGGVIANSGATNGITSYQDSGLTAGHTYTYNVVAVNSGGKSSALSGSYVAPQVPAAPVGFKATYVSTTSVTLTWTADSAATNGYKLYRAAMGSTTFTPINVAIAAASQSYTDTTIAASTKYDYQLLASNVAGDSAAATLTYVPPPLPPTNFSATAVNGGSVDLAWTQGDSISDSFELSRSDNGAAFVAVGGVIANSGATNGVTSHQDSGLTAGHTYTYNVVAVNSGGKSSALSGSYVAPQVPAAPVGFSATYVSATSVTLTWTADSAATNGYKLYRAAMGSTTFTPINVAIAAASQSYTDTTIAASTKYDYQLLASNVAGDSAPASLSYIPPPLPATSFVANSVSDTLVDLSWTQGDSITDSYELSRADNGGAFVAVGGVILNSGATNGVTAYQDSGLIGGHTYTYNVVSVNGGGKSSALSYSYTSPLKPIAPALNASLAAGPAVNLSWGAVDAATTKLVLSKAAAGTSNFIDIYTQSAAPFATSYSDSAVVAGSNYDYRLLAYNGVVVSDPVLASNVVIPAALATPVGFSASYVSATQVNLSWTVDAAATLGYKLYRAPSGGVFAPVNDTIAAGVGSYIDNTIAASTVYDYQLIASNVSGTSAAATLTYTPPPLPPSALSAQQLNNTSIRLSWTAGDNLVDGYVLMRQDAPNGAFNLISNSIAGNASSYDDTALLDNHAYVYELYAFNNAGGASTTVSLSYTTLAKPVAPALSVSLAAGPVVNLSWGAPDAVTKIIELSRSPASAASFALINSATAAGSYSDSTVTIASAYDYQLVAFNGVMVSDPVVVSNVVIPGAPLAPSNLAVSEVTATSALLSWSDNSNNEDAFEVERAEQTGPTTWSAFVLVKTEPSNSTSSVDNSLTYAPGKHYKYHVVAKNISGSAISNEISTQSPPQDSHSFLAFANKSAPRFQETDVTAQAYYDAVDPQHLKTTVADWKRLNGFGNGGPQDTPAVYVNDADLGFARRMYVNSKVPGSQPGVYNVASYVENYATLQKAITGLPSDIIATVAMEYTEPANPGSQPEIIATAPNYDLIPNYTATTSLSPGTYIIRVAPDLYLGDFTTRYSFRIVDTNSSNLLINDANRTWSIGRFQNNTSADYLSFNTDFSGNEYVLNVTTPISVRFELDSPVNTTIYLGKQYKVINQASALTPGGSATLTSVNLPEGEYRVLIGTAQLFSQPTNLSNSAILTLTYPTHTESLLTSISLGTSSDPTNPYNNYDNKLYVYPSDILPGGTTVPVTIDLSLDATNTNSPLMPMIFLVDSSNSAQGTPVTILEFMYSNISQNISRSSQLISSLPDGSYSAVVTAKKYDLNFGLNFFDVITQGNFVCLGGAPTAVALSQGPNPFIAGNPRCNFSMLGGAPNTALNLLVSNTDVDASGRPLPTGDPVVKVLGVPKDFRNIVAWAKPAKLPFDPRVIIRKKLPAGNYTLVPVALDFGNAASYQLSVTDTAASASLLNVQSGWSVTTGLHLNAADNLRHAFTVAAAGANVEIVLTVPESGVTVGSNLRGYALYLLDANGTVIDQSEDYKDRNGALEADVLAGDYQITLVSNSTKELTYRSTATVRYYVDGVLTNTFNGVVSDLDTQNPLSPNALGFPVSLANSAHVRVEFDSDFSVNAYLIGKGDRKFVTFYTFMGQVGLDGLTQNGRVPPPAPFYPPNLAAGDRVLAANLDTRGDKYQPGVCNVCHGGAPKSLVAGVYPDQGDTNAGFLAWDMDLFKYDTQAGSPYERATLEPTIREFNRTVLSVQRDATQDVPGQNSYQYVRNQLIYGWYGGVGLPNAFNGNYVPPGWIGQEQLYLQVVKPTCRLCHTQRDGIFGPKIAFGSYSDFVGYKDDIERLVYDKGSMPLAKRTFDHFWSQGQADILAQALDTTATPFTRYDNQNQVLQPGRPIAVGPYRVDLPQKLLIFADIKRYMLTGGTINLDGSESLFANKFNWSVVSAPAGASYILNGATTANPTFTPGSDGDYTLQLVVGDGVNSSVPASFVVNASSTYAPVSFANNLLVSYDKLTNFYDYPDYPVRKNPFRGCIGCHSLKEQDYSYTDSRSSNYPAQENSNTYLWSLLGDPLQVYNALRDRVNLSDPLESRILQTGDWTHHNINPFGWGWDDVYNDWQHFNLLLRWINEGAPNN